MTAHISLAANIPADETKTRTCIFSFKFSFHSVHRKHTKNIHHLLEVA